MSDKKEHKKISNSIVITICCIILVFVFCAIPLLSSVKSNVIAFNTLFDEYKTKVNNRYVIDDTINLNGADVFIPSGICLEFKKGIIRNGTLRGDSTIILSSTNQAIFADIILEGSWKLENISTNLFEKTDINTLANISCLSSEKHFNRITIDSNCVAPIKPWSSWFIIKSNTALILNADIYTLPTKYKGGYCMMIDGENITIDGNGHYLFGCLSSPYQKECSEWLHGLSINKSSSQVKVFRLNSWYFCGDGFYSQGSDVLISNVNAKFNGRQGLSITNGKNIVIKDSYFSKTGYYKIASGGGPGAGIDIEPNKGDSVNNIFIKDCRMADNFQYMDGQINDLEIYGTSNAKIEISNCYFSGLYLGDCSNVRIDNCTELKTIYYINKRVDNIKLYKSSHPQIIYRK